MNAFLINLDRRPDRLAAVSQTLRQIGVPFKRVPAIDGLTLVVRQYIRGFLLHLYGKHHEHLPGSLGCFLSHRSVWEHIIANKIAAAMVLEDDIYSYAWDPRLLTLELLSKDIDVLRIGRLMKPNRGEQYISKLRLDGERYSEKILGRDAIIDDTTRGANAYIVTYEGAKKLLKVKKYWFPVDDWATWRSLYGVRSYLLWPPAFLSTKRIGSDIYAGDSSHRHHRRYRKAAKRNRRLILTLIRHARLT